MCESRKSSILEMSSGTLSDGADTDEFLEASDRMQVSFLFRQKGYVRRSLLLDKTGAVTDLIFWETWEDARTAAENALNHEQVSQYTEFFDKTGMRTQYLEILRDY